MPFSESGVTPRSSCSTDRSWLRPRGLLGRHRPVPVRPTIGVDLPADRRRARANLAAIDRKVSPAPRPTRIPTRSPRPNQLPVASSMSARITPRQGRNTFPTDPKDTDTHPAISRPDRPALPGASPHAAPLGSTRSSYPASVPHEPLDRVNKLPRSSPPIRVTSCNHRSCVGRTRLRYFTADRIIPSRGRGS